MKKPMLSILPVLFLALVYLPHLDSTEAWAGSYIRIDTLYPPIGPRWIPDITRPGDSVGLASDEIIDILILGDGYLPAESARFVSHAHRWYDSTFGSGDTAIGIRPYTYFKQAFRVRAVWEPSAGRASVVTRDSSHYRVKIDPSDTSVASDEWWDGDSEPNRGFRDSLFKTIDELPDPRDTTRYPPTLSNTVYGHLLVHSPMAEVYSHLYIALLIRASGDENPGGRCRNVTKYGESQRVRVAFGAYEMHEFGHAFGYLDDEYIGGRGTVNTEYRNPAPADRSVFNLVNINFLPVNVEYDDPDDRCDDMLIWPHLVPGGEHNSSVSSLIGNMFTGMDKFATGAAHSEYKCLMNGTHENYFCGFSGPDTNLRDYNNMCFWCEEITVLRILERTDQLDRPGDSADINARGRQWFRLWDDSLRDAYYSYFNVDSVIVLKDSCFDLSCPGCSTNCGATTTYPLPSCIGECAIRDVGHAVFVDGDNGDNLNVGSNIYPKRTIQSAVSAVCDPHYVVMMKSASYPGAITISDRATLVAAGCSSVIIGK